MRIFSVGDLHGDRSLAQKLAKKAGDEDVDLVVICGDFTFFDEEPKGIIKPFLEVKKKVLIIPGNHDSLASHDVLTKTYPIKDLHGYSVKYEDVGIFGCGKANIGVERLEEEEIHETLKKAHEKISYLKKKIMVTHVHPSGTVMEKLTNFFPGSPGVRKAIEEFKPDVAFCSHVHEAEGLEEQIGKTRVINVGRKGFILDI
jgi:Icc-related predicted phosphoesterase